MPVGGSQSTPDTVFRLEGAPNFRDIGGYAGIGGRTVRRGRLFRSDTLSRLTERDFDRMAGLGVHLVCDLRSEVERSHRPTRWPRHYCPEVLHFDVNADLRAADADMLQILRADPSESGAVAMMIESYRTIPMVLRAYLGPLFRRIAAGEATPLVFHCSAGKDRTGVMSAVLLRSLGVSREDVITDYLLTRRYGDVAALEGTVADVTGDLLGYRLAPEVVSAIAAVRESYIDTALRAIEGGDGSMAGYLADAGVTENLLKEVRQQLLL